MSLIKNCRIQMLRPVESPKPSGSSSGLHLLAGQVRVTIYRPHCWNSEALLSTVESIKARENKYHVNSVFCPDGLACLH